MTNINAIILVFSTMFGVAGLIALIVWAYSGPDDADDEDIEYDNFLGGGW
jgi:hypothetical protein